MKKTISLLLCAIMTFSLFAVTAAAEENPLVITVANDLHLNVASSSAETVSKKNSVSEEYAHASSGGQLHYESLAVIKSFLALAGNNESEFIILPGDITDSGKAEEHTALAAMLKEFEETYGKKVFVVAGNHDLLKTSVAEFEGYYAEFGYNEALVNDPASASYTAELNDEYRLLAIDSCNPGKSPNGMTSERIDWIEAQCKAAKADGKKLIAIMHHNLLEHYILASQIHTGAVVTKDSMRLADVLADNGVKYIFTAHTHNHDITSYTSAAGNVIYDVVTTSINAYPCAYRVVSFGEKAVFRTDYVRSIDTSILPAGIHEAALATAESNFLLYAKNCTYLGVEIMVSSYTKAAQLKKLINTDNEAINGIIDKAAQKIEEVVSLPFYAKDEAVEGKSIESMAKNLGITLPATNYPTLINLATCIYQKNAEGDENFAAYSDEMILFSRGLAVAINYALSDVSAEEFTLILSYVASLLGVNISEDLIGVVGGSIDKFRGSELFVTSVAVPIFAKFGVDEAPADKNVTLPGYDSDKPAESFLDKIMAFLKKIFDFFHMILAMIA